MTTKEKIKSFEDEYKKLLEKYGLEMSMEMDFPQYKILPAKLQLALQIIFEENLQYRAVYKEAKKEEK